QPLLRSRWRCPRARTESPQTGLTQAPAYTRAIMAVRRVASLIALVLGTLLAVGHAQAADPTGVGRIRLTGVIDQVNAAYIEDALKSAADTTQAAVIIQINSPGGDLASMDRMLQAILASRVPVLTWVAPEGAGAGSAATFITLAGDVAAMAPSTSIGAAAVVGSGGADLPTTEATKVTNFYASKIRQLASTHDRNADWPESAVLK